MRQWTETVNALRAGLYEFGHVIPQGIQHVGRIRAILEAPNSDLPALMREECLVMLDQIAALDGWISAKTARIKELAAATPVSMRLQTMPGVGPLVAMAVETFAPDMTSFHNGRDFAAWLGLVPRQFSSGGKERLGRITKAGQTDIRQMLIIGAMSRLNWMGRKAIPESSWLARQIWAMLTKGRGLQESDAGHGCLIQGQCRQAG